MLGVLELLLTPRQPPPRFDSRNDSDTALGSVCWNRYRTVTIGRVARRREAVT